MFLKPKQAHDNDNNVDKAQVGENRDEVDVELLVQVERLYIYAVPS